MWRKWSRSRSPDSPSCRVDFVTLSEIRTGYCRCEPRPLELSDLATLPQPVVLAIHGPQIRAHGGTFPNLPEWRTLPDPCIPPT